MKFRRNFLSRIFRSPEPGDDGLGVSTGAPSVTAPAAGESAPDSTTQAAPDAGASKAGSMLEAMFGQKPADTEPTQAEAQEAAATGKTVQQLRDEKGRFAGKAPTDPTVPPLVDPKKPPDPNAMPEGLSPKAQERFQTLANTNKELTARVSEWEPIVQSALGLQEVFQTNGVKREQFEQAMQVVGLMNRGDLDGALKVLDEQRAMISMHLGRPVPGADALANFPDLRSAVDNLQMTEEYALEIARGRHVQQRQTQQHQTQQREQQTQQQAHQAVQHGQLAVDKFCKARMADDLDYARIEPMLLKEIEAGLLQDVPPSAWARIVEKTYGIIKQTATATRHAAPSTSVLRPTGGESPRQAPKSMYDAMWNKA
jgi:hypothetical protein